MRKVHQLILGLSLLAVGCGDSSGVGRTYPVKGKLTLDGKSFTAESTTILFSPDSSKGNQSPFSAAGTVDEEGNYTLYTKEKAGAPLGWYKVTIAAYDAEPAHAKSVKHGAAVTKSLLPGKYGNPKTSDIAIEVVENPDQGAYDIKLSTKK